jgi:tetratricopeptide (TPR) repeat protein
LFKDPVSLLAEPDPSRLEVDIAITKPTTEEAIANITPQSPEGASSLTPDARELVRTAQQLFDEKNYTEAEKTYQSLASLLPDNYFILANLGAVQIEAGKLAAAEIALAKAIEISPEDSFAHTHLGIAYSRQGRFDDARSVLTRATEIDARDAVAFNYLGVCLAQQGLRDDSEKHLKNAIALDPNYANAHFNLAVLYATTKPPAVELAKQHYDLATRLGASPDASLERLIQ